MRILYCNKYNFNFSGTEAYLFELMEMMRSKGHEVALFSMADPRGEESPYDSHFVPFVDFKASALNPVAQARLAARAIYSRDARRRLRRMIADFRPQVSHVRNIYHHLSPSILWELKTCHVPVLYHLNDFKLLCPSYNMVSRGSACERCKGGKFWHVLSEGCYSGPPGSTWLLAAEAYLHRWLRTYQKCVDVFLAPSRFVKEKLVENNWNAAKIAVLPHFQRLPGEKPQDVRTDAPILYFGRLSPEKGVRDLLLAMLALPHVRLQVAGDGPQRVELETLARNLGLRNVRFLGHLQTCDLQPSIAGARFSVLPSRAYETLGKSILESYAHGRPVVASDLGSRRELVQDGKTGLLFQSGNIAALERAIAHLAEHPSQAAEMGACGRQFVRDQHSPEAHYEAMSTLYEQLQSGDPAGPQPPPPADPRLRVAFIGGRGVISKYSGIETYYEEAGKRLAALGHEVTIYCRSYFTPALKEYEGMRLVRLPTIRSKHLDTAVHTLMSSVHAGFSGHDIVHYHALGPALFSFIPRVFRQKTAVTVQGLDWQRKKWNWLASAVLRQGEAAAARMPDATMVVSRTLQSYYRAHHAAETIYIPNGAILQQSLTPSALSSRATLSQWDLAPNQYLLFLGRFSPEKNCHLLLEAYRRIDSPVKLVMAGGSIYSEGYAKYLRAQATTQIRVLDWVSGLDRNELLMNAMLVVLPSDVEGLSLVLLEAMGAGVCVLASDIPENREVLAEAGFTFRHGDVRDLARMLTLLIAHPGMRQTAAELGRQRVKQQYLWDNVASEIDTVYRGLAGRRQHPAALPVVKRPPSPVQPKKAA